jgi:glycosyltransferase involved in cell wall biosynthesis
MSRRIAILQDSPDFGGHERMFLTWLPGLLDSADVEAVHLRCPAANVRFLSALQTVSHPKLTLHPDGDTKGKGEPFAAPLRVGYGRGVSGFVRACRADLVLLLQGRIENLATPTLWLPRGLELVNYLPMAHSGVDMGRPAAVAALTDGVKRLYYARPNRTIVVSQAVATQARRAGAAGPIYVVENVPPGRPDAAVSANQKDAARGRLGLAASGRIALFMGRFDTHQKGLDHLLRDLEGGGAALVAWRFVFVGQGPAAGDLKALLGRGVVSGQVVPWTDEPGLYLQAADLLLLPSRFEGVPLVMLEALQQGLPILASDIDVYREYLLAEALRDFGRPVDLAAALDALVAPDARARQQAHARQVAARLDAEQSRRRFTEAVLGQRAPDLPALRPASSASARLAS